MLELFEVLFNVDFGPAFTAGLPVSSPMVFAILKCWLYSRKTVTTKALAKLALSIKEPLHNAILS